MKYVTLISIILILLSSVFLGCVKAPVGTPTPTATVTETVKPTAVPTTPSPTPTPTPARIPAVYKSDVDDILGFYQVRIINSTVPPIYTYNNLTLTINVGDKVIWVSDSEDYTITILSEQGLWDKNESRAKLRWKFQEFNYTFNQLGTYGIYVREFLKIRHQKIIVMP